MMVSESQGYSNICVVLGTLTEWSLASSRNPRDPASLSLTKCHWAWLDLLNLDGFIIFFEESLNLVEIFRY